MAASFQFRLSRRRLGTTSDGRRLAQRLLQQDVAKVLGVEPTSIRNWEGTTSAPGDSYMPGAVLLAAHLGAAPVPG